MAKVKDINDFEDVNDYTHIDDRLPTEKGVYDVIIHSGSMSIWYIKSEKLFYRGAFPRMDWDYVIMWKEK